MFEARKRDSEARRQSAINATRRILERTTPEQLVKNKNENFKRLSLFRSFQNHSRVIAHFDLDYFFVQAQLLRNPELRNRPVAAGSEMMISTSNYVARKHKVKAAMPGVVAKQLCPDLVILPLDFKLYSRLSAEFHSIMRSEGDHFSSGGIDEAYIDLTGRLEKFVDPKYIRCHAVSGSCPCRLPRLEDLVSDNDVYEEISTKVCDFCGQEETEYLVELHFPPTLPELIRFIRMRVLVELNLTCSGGCAPTYPVAKVCSDRNKPNGQTIVTSAEFQTFNLNSKLNVFWGIGPVTNEKLSAFGIETIQDAVDNIEKLNIILGSGQLDSLLALMAGLNGPPYIDGPLNNPSGKSCINDSDEYTVGHESTFTSSADPEYISKRLEEVVEHAIHQASKEAKVTSAISLKIKYEDYSIHTRNQGVPSLPFTDKEHIFMICSSMLEKSLGASIRLLGVRFTISSNDTKLKKTKIQSRLLFENRKSTDKKSDDEIEVLEFANCSKLKNERKKNPEDTISEDEAVRELLDIKNPKRKKLSND